MRSVASEEGRDAASLGVYLHFPFCSARCGYCDFATVAGRDERIDAYLDALAYEITALQPDAPRSADTVFLGGGTPSRMSGPQLATVLEAVRERFDLEEGAEITIEGNPEDFTRARIEAWRGAGVDRVSVGVQSLDDAVLRRAGRAHGAREAEAAVVAARAAGFESVSVDLIAGLPGENLDRWPETVRRVASLEPDHVSVYLLETDKDAPLARAARSGKVAIADDDAFALAYARTVEALEGAGFAQYEISNFARPGAMSRHNVKYWTDAPFAGFGLGAHGYVAGERRSNRRDLEGYIADVRAGRSPADWTDPWDPERRLQEALFLGLRVAWGVDLAALRERYGIDPTARYRDAWERAEEAGLIAREGSRVRLTRSGRVMSNALFAELV